MGIRRPPSVPLLFVTQEMGLMWWDGNFLGELNFHCENGPSRNEQKIFALTVPEPLAFTLIHFSVSLSSWSKFNLPRFVQFITSIVAIYLLLRHEIERGLRAVYGVQDDKYDKYDKQPIILGVLGLLLIAIPPLVIGGYCPRMSI